MSHAIFVTESVGMTGFSVLGRLLMSHATSFTLARFGGVGKVWVLDTETKGTGANMVPLDKARKPAEPGPALRKRRQSPSEARTEPRRPGKPAVRAATATELPPGHVRKKATGEIGRIEAVDARAGTARVRWLKRGASSTVPLSAISRR